MTFDMVKRSGEGDQRSLEYPTLSPQVRVPELIRIDAPMSACGTSETNEFSRLESAIGVRPDVGAPPAQG